MKKDFYTDTVLGTWKLVKKTKKDLNYQRKAEIKLHRDHALSYFDPKTFEEYLVWGDLVLVENKILNIETSDQSMFRGVELTGKTEKYLVIK